MNQQAWSFRRVSALSVAAVSIAALGAAAASWVERSDVPVATRPAADAPVEVVRMPASVPAHTQACPTCTMGHTGKWL